MSEKRVAIIIGSTRNPRVGPRVAKLVYDVLARSANQSTALALVDIADFNLPIFDEPAIPAYVTSAADYKHEHTRKWSEEISKYDAYVFVTCAYNSSIPAGLKNALDFLFNEWKGKPAMVVSYGVNGGDKAADALLPICKGLRMLPIEDTVQLSLSAVEGGNRSAQNEGELAAGLEDAWKADLEKLTSLFEHMEQRL